MKKILKLQDHKHTAKILPHHHTSYRALSVLLILSFLMLFGFDWVVRADNYTVTASVPAPLPTTPSTIDSPLSNSEVVKSAITVLGKCQILNPAVIVSIYNNGQPAGSTSCSVSGSYSIEITLAQGVNLLVAKTFSITNDEGPASIPVSVIYNLSELKAPTLIPKNIATNSTSTANNPPSTVKELRVSQDRPYITFTIDQPLEWLIVIEGGVGPYNIETIWGDGTVDKSSQVALGPYKLQHTYTERKSFYPSTTVSDSLGNKASLRVVAVTYGKIVVPGVVGKETFYNKPGLSPTMASAVVAYSATGILLFAVWLKSAAFANTAFLPKFWKWPK